MQNPEWSQTKSWEIPETNGNEGHQALLKGQCGCLTTSCTPEADVE